MRRAHEFKMYFSDTSLTFASDGTYAVSPGWLTASKEGTGCAKEKKTIAPGNCPSSNVGGDFKQSTQCVTSCIIT